MVGRSCGDGRRPLIAWVVRATGWAALVLIASLAFGQTQPASGRIDGSISTQRVTPLAGVEVAVLDATGRVAANATSGADGRFVVPNLAPGTYQVRAALEGFDTTTESVVVPAGGPISVALDLPIAKLSDTIDVVATTVGLSTLSTHTLAPVEAIASRELDQFVPGAGFQGAVRMLANVVTTSGGLSIKGGRPGQAGVQLGAATLVDPASGLAQVLLPDDAIESVTVLPNPYAVEYGRFSSGLAVIQSRRARDQWKFRLNRFGPSFRSSNDSTFGFRVDSYNPRLEVGGPLVDGRLFLEEAAQGRYSVGDLASIPEDQQRITKAFASFTRLDAKASPRHSLTATAGIFPGVSERATIGTFTPPEATVDVKGFGKQASLVERAVWTDRAVSESTFQWYESTTDVDPQGAAAMQMRPDILLGNFFNKQHRATSTYQLVQTISAHKEGIAGSHLVKGGVDVLFTQYRGSSESRTILIERTDGAIVRRLDFLGPSAQSANATEAAVFAQDRWQWRPRWYVEGGARLDRDGVLRHVNVSPRIGSAVLLTESGSVVVRGGWGLFAERTPSVAGVFAEFEGAFESRFASLPAVRVKNSVAPALETPLSYTWDAAIDYRLNAEWAFHAGLLRREGRYELIVSPLATASGIERRLSSDGRSSYRDVELRAQYTRGAFADVEVTYTHSRSEGDLNALTAYFDSLLSPILGENAYARLNTDVPDRVFIRGRVMPAPKWLLLGVYDWHTGVSYSIVNEMLDFVGPRNVQRFPNYSRLELGVEHRFKVLKFQPWIGVRMTNILGQFLPTDVQNNTTSPSFGAFYNAEPRRIRMQARFER